MNVNSKLVYYSALSLMIVWMLVGVFPLICYESDSMHVIAGCNTIVNQGFITPPLYSYQYDMQPLITYVVASQRILFPLLTCEQWYCLDSAFAAILFLFGSLKLAQKISHAPRGLVLLAAFLIPETVAIGMYPNTTVFAAVFFVWGLLFIEKRKILAVVFLCIAPLFRVDVVIVYPVLLFIYLKLGIKLKDALKKSIIDAVIVLIVLIFGFYALGANPFNSLATYKTWNETGEYASKVLFSAFSFLTLINFILLPLGLYRMISYRKKINIIVVLVPIILLAYMFRSSATAAKHWAYLIPFVLVISVNGIETLIQKFHNNSMLKYISYCLLGLFLVVSVRIDMPMEAKKWMNTDYSSANMGPVWMIKENMGGHNLRFGIGAGHLIPTADEWMLSSGNLFYPFYICNYKVNRYRILESEKKYLSRKSNYNLYTFSWESAFSYTSLLQNEGYKMKKMNGAFVFEKGNARINEYSAPNCYDNEHNLRLALFKIKSANSFISTMHENEEMLMRKMANQGIVKRVAENLYSITLK